MRSIDLTIRARLIIGFGVLTLITVVMGALAVLAMRELTDVTRDMYRHPLTVSNAVRDIRSHIITMDRNMKDVVLVRDDVRVDELAALIDEDERRVLDDYALVRERFLGDKEIVDNARLAFVEWRPIRESVFELMHAGRRDEAADVTMGVGAEYIEHIQELNTLMSDFASAKADEFYINAKHFDRRVLTMTIGVLIILVLTSIMVALFIARSITDPLRIVTEGIKGLSTGRFDQHIELDRNDEIGLLAQTLNDMARELKSSTTSIENLQVEIQGREQAQDRARTLGRVIEESLNEVYLLNAESLAVIQVNRGGRENLGYSTEDLEQLGFLDVQPGRDRDTFMTLIEPLLKGEQARLRYQTRHVRKDGTHYPAEIDLQCADFSDRRVLIAVGVDVTERIRLQEERRQLDAKVQHTQKLESLGVLAGGIAHDFNNILMTILGNASLALEGMSQSSSAHECLIGIQTASTRAADLCRQMLAYSGRGRFEITTLNLSDVVEEIGKMLEVSISKKAILKYNLHQALPPVQADASQVGQVVLNLITNASDAIGDKSGVISITTGAQYCDQDYLNQISHEQGMCPGYYVYLEVNDTGCGMNSETMERLFEPFFTTKFTGRGLGMAAVLGIIQGHKGTLKIYSEEGKGTSIKLLLPAADESDLVEIDPEILTSGPIGEGVVLLVDDEETIRALGQRMLERMGYRVLLAEDGNDAVELFRDHAEEISVVLLDLTMPHMDGKDAFRELRRIRPDVPIILSSGYDESDVTHLFAGRGLAGFIQKPYQPHELATKLAEILKG